jgi:hypothetical protein
MDFTTKPQTLFNYADLFRIIYIRVSGSKVWGEKERDGHDGVVWVGIDKDSMGLNVTFYSKVYVAI